MSRLHAVELVRTGKRFMLTCHREPDADALGSALGLAAVLRAVGKGAIVWVPEEPSESLRFLPGIETVVRELAPGERFDATFVTDTASKVLLPYGFPGPEVTGPVVVVDHHAAHDDFGEVVVREDACATGEVVLRIMEELGVHEVPEAAAAPIYAAIVADTGGFRYATTTADTMRIGARLIERGADPWETAYNLFEGWREPRLRLLAAVIDTLEVDLDGKLALLRVTREMLERLGATDEMVEGMVNYARMLRGVEVAALVWERRPEVGADGTQRPVTRVSLRSRRAVDVARIATALGGGGHRAAAGATLAADLTTAAARIRVEAARLLEA